MVAVNAAGKVQWKPGARSGSRQEMLPQRRICKRAEAMLFLGQQLFKDAEAAKWIAPCSTKPGKTDRKEAAVFFRVSDLLAVEDRVARGEYPVSAEDAESGRGKMGRVGNANAGGGA